MLQGQTPAGTMMLEQQKKTAHNIQEHVENSRMFSNKYCPCVDRAFHQLGMGVSETLCREEAKKL